MSKQSDYWHEREVEWKNSRKNSEKQYEKKIQEIYQSQLDSIETQIESFFSKYATSEGITMAEAKKKASEIDIEKYKRKAEKYVKEKNFSSEAQKEMKLYNMTMKVNRLELLKANIGLDLVSGADELKDYTGQVLQGEVLERIKHDSSILGDTVINNSKFAKTVANSSYMNATFSDRIWAQQDQLKNSLTNILSNALIQGKSARTFIPQVRKQFGVSSKQAERLLRTEIARAQTQAQAENYDELGLNEYEYIACGLKDCCEICKALDGQVFKVKDMECGKNAPPMHPNCHCATAPHIDRQEFNKWLDEKEISQTDLSYDEWKSSKAQMATTNSNDWSNTKTQSYTKEEQREFVKYAKEKGIKLVGVNNFDGDGKLLKQQIDSLNSATKKYPLRQKKKLTLSLSSFNNDDDFAYTNGMTITLNTKILRNKEITEQNLKNSNYFASPRIQDIVVHEYGHVLSSQYGNRGIELAKKTYYNLYKKELSTDEILDYLKKDISKYSVSYYGDLVTDIQFNKVKFTKFKEITSEIISKNEYSPTLFTQDYLRNLFER